MAAVVVTVLVEVVRGKNIRGFRTLEGVSHDVDGNGYDNGDVFNSESVVVTVTNLHRMRLLHNFGWVDSSKAVSGEDREEE